MQTRNKPTAGNTMQNTKTIKKTSTPAPAKTGRGLAAVRKSAGLCLCLATVLSFSSCGIYGKFKGASYQGSEQVFGPLQAAPDSVAEWKDRRMGNQWDSLPAYTRISQGDSLNLGQCDWRSFFTDPYLTALIDTALKNNADMQTALLNVQEAQASLKASKLAFLPSFNISPGGGISGTTDQAGSWSYQLPVNASWEIDLFGNLLNSKRSRQAALLQTQAYAQAVRSQLIATVAATYYALLALDEQSRIYAETEASWRQNVSVTSHLVEGGKANSASLSQTQANYYNVLNQLIDIRQQVMQTENSLCSLLGIPPQEISRGRMDDWQSPTDIQVGIPLLVLRQRPDVNQAEQALAQAFYNTQQARSEFFPSITITGTFDFGEMLYNALGSLFQPIFQSGTLKANLDIAKAQEKEAEIGFRQTLIDAGIEVNDAIMAVKSAQAKTENYALQVSHLQDAVQSTQLLMKHGSTTYLEVLTAQQSLLSAQISQVANRLTEISSCISLYQALGGGTSADTVQTADSKKRK